MIPYIASPKLRTVGISLFLMGVLTGVGLGLVHHFSGEIVGTADTTEPLPQTNLAEQSLQAQSQALLQNTMNKMGVPAFRTDDIQKLDMTFLPLHLSPDMGKVELQLEIHTSGIVASGNITSVDQVLKRTHYELLNQASGKAIFQNETKRAFPSDPDERGSTSKIVINGKDSKATVRSGLKYIRVGMVDIPQDGDYVLHATIEKLKFAFPIESIKLIAKKDTLPLPGFAIIASIIGSILLGTILCILTTTPELRNKKKVNVRM